MGSVGAALAGAVPDGTAESVADEGDRERDLLRAPIGLRLAALARQLPAAADGRRWFLRLRDDCVLERLNHHLVMLDPRAAGAPPALRRGCSTAKASRRRRPAGRGATTPARRSRAAKRHALVDTDGRPLVLEPHPADIQDRDGGGPVLNLPRATPFPSSRRSSPVGRCSICSPSVKAISARPGCQALNPIMA